MNIGLIAFTERGAETGAAIIEKFQSSGQACQGYTKGSFRLYDMTLVSCNESLSEWTGSAFSKYEAIVFVGAVGIAVRAIAPYIKSKSEDPAVLTVDETGRYVIPLVSGHIGGANRLALEIARFTGGEPVITTATDINGRFAVDRFAAEQGLVIGEMKLAKQVSVDLLQNKTVGFHSSFPVKGDLPEGLTENLPKDDPGVTIELSVSAELENGNTLQLIPKALILGIGCRSGTKVKEIEELVLAVMESNNLSIKAVSEVASIDLKEKEEGLLGFCRKYNLPFSVFTGEELSAVAGEFTPSSFVKSVTGVDNVCERAAMLASGAGELIVKKSVKSGVTVAVAMKNMNFSFEIEPLNNEEDRK